MDSDSRPRVVPGRRQRPRGSRHYLRWPHHARSRRVGGRSERLWQRNRKPALRPDPADVRRGLVVLPLQPQRAAPGLLAVPAARAWNGHDDRRFIRRLLLDPQQRARRSARRRPARAVDRRHDARSAARSLDQQFDRARRVPKRREPVRRHVEEGHRPARRPTLGRRREPDLVRPASQSAGAPGSSFVQLALDPGLRADFHRERTATSAGVGARESPGPRRSVREPGVRDPSVRTAEPGTERVLRRTGSAIGAGHAPVELSGLPHSPADRSLLVHRGHPRGRRAGLQQQHVRPARDDCGRRPRRLRDGTQPRLARGDPA